MFKLIKKINSTNIRTRESWLERKLKEVSAGSKILDAGAGELQYKRFCSHLDYVSQDFGGYDGVGNSEGLQMEKWDNSKLDIVSDITAIPQPDQSFDAIMCIEVFEHISEPIEAVKEFSRLLKPNGKLILTAPFCSLTHFAPYFFYTGYSKYWYEKFLTDNGFTIKEIYYNGNFFSYLTQEMIRLPRVIINFSSMNILLKYLIILLLLLPLGFSITIVFILSRFDNKSQDILCFGLHILAEKNNFNL